MIGTVNCPNGKILVQSTDGGPSDKLDNLQESKSDQFKTILDSHISKENPEGSEEKTGHDAQEDDPKCLSIKEIDVTSSSVSGASDELVMTEGNSTGSVLGSIVAPESPENVMVSIESSIDSNKTETGNPENNAKNSSFNKPSILNNQNTSHIESNEIIPKTPVLKGELEAEFQEKKVQGKIENVIIDAEIPLENGVEAKNISVPSQGQSQDEIEQTGTKAEIHMKNGVEAKNISVSSQGQSQGEVEQADTKVEIPLKNGIESKNISVSSQGQSQGEVEQADTKAEIPMKNGVEAKNISVPSQGQSQGEVEQAGTKAEIPMKNGVEVKNISVPSQGQSQGETEQVGTKAEIPIKDSIESKGIQSGEINAVKFQKTDIDEDEVNRSFEQNSSVNNWLKSDKLVPTKELSDNFNPETIIQNKTNTPSDMESSGVKSDQTEIPLISEEPVISQANSMESQQDELPRGFQVRNVQSALHAADPAEHASVSATQTPSRTGGHTETASQTVEPIDQIFNRISTMTVSQAQQRISLTLSPQNLGAVRITFQHEGDEIIGMLEVQKLETCREIQETLPQLLSSMQDSGIQIRRIEVVQWDSNQQTYKDDLSDGLDSSMKQEFSQQSSQNSSDANVPGRNRSNRDNLEVSIDETSKYMNTNALNEEDKGLNLLI